MKPLSEIVTRGRLIRSLGIDDAPFDRAAGSPVSLAGIVCRATRFEGMLWGRTTKDGLDATDVILDMVLNSKFHAQIHVVLLDGIAVGGLNIVDLPRLAGALDRPCVAVMRRLPDLAAMHAAIARIPDAEERLARLERAGPIHQAGGFFFQVVGEDPVVIPRALATLCDQGQVPEPLRLAHLIGAAVQTGQSSRRA